MKFMWFRMKVQFGCFHFCFVCARKFFYSLLSSFIFLFLSLRWVCQFWMKIIVAFFLAYYSEWTQKCVKWVTMSTENCFTFPLEIATKRPIRWLIERATRKKERIYRVYGIHSFSCCCQTPNYDATTAASAAANDDENEVRTQKKKIVVRRMRA